MSLLATASYHATCTTKYPAFPLHPVDHMPLNEFSAALSTEPDWRDATSQLCDEIGTSPKTSYDMAVVFISTHHQENVAAIADQIRTDLGCSYLIGCTGESIN